MWKFCELWFWQRVTFEDGTRSKRGEVVMKEVRFRRLTKEEQIKREWDNFEESASSF